MPWRKDSQLGSCDMKMMFSAYIGRTDTEKFYTVEPPSWDDRHHFHFAEERDLCRREARREWVGHSGLLEAAVMPWRRL